jgi:hypothetical protein
MCVEPRNSDVEAGADLTAEVDLTARPTHTDLHDPRVRAEVEGALISIPGVMGARVVPGFDRQVDELHVLTKLDKQAKQAVRDVQTVLMARYGVPTDHRVISVVQLDEAARPVGSTHRVVIDRVAVAQSGMRATIEVVLRDGEDELVGHIECASSSGARIRGVAQATLDATRPLVGEGLVVELEGADVTAVLGRRLAVTLVHLRDRRSEQTLAGSALVRDDEADAIARSVLDALNRTIEDVAER